MTKMTLKFWTDKPGEKPVIVPLDTESKLDAEKIAFELSCILNAAHTRQSLTDATSIYSHEVNQEWDHIDFEFMVV